jgi:DNA-binding transcriptional regulator YiaG
MIDVGIPTFPTSEIQKLRKQLGMTQSELAETLGVARSLVACWERNIRQPSGPAAILLSQMKARAGLEEKSAVPA